jgi:hypothetical protein
MIPMSTCSKCGKQYVGWALEYKTCKCCDIKLELEEE